MRKEVAVIRQIIPRNVWNEFIVEIHIQRRDSEITWSFFLKERIDRKLLSLLERFCGLNDENTFFDLQDKGLMLYYGNDNVLKGFGSLIRDEVYPCGYMPLKIYTEMEFWDELIERKSE